jgi:hypothetical protein
MKVPIWKENSHGVFNVLYKHVLSQTEEPQETYVIYSFS